MISALHVTVLNFYTIKNASINARMGIMETTITPVSLAQVYAQHAR